MRKKSAVLSTVVVAFAIMLTACSSTSSYKGVYESQRDDRPLEVPPDLSAPDVQSGLHIPQLASQQGGANVSAGSQVAPLQYGKARLVRESSLRWLEVAMPIEQVWGPLQAFFRGLGFKFVREDQALGLLETDWLENRFDVPTNWLSKLFSKVYDTGLMDSYRIRLERSADAQHTLVFIAHRGLKEVYENEENDVADSKGWTVRASDPELENEMLQRFAINLGGDKAALERQRGQLEQQPEFASVVLQDGVVVLKLNEGFARGWRRVGLALDRMGVLIEDRNRAQGAYFIHLSEELLKQEGGLFAKLFSGKTEVTRNEYLLRLIEKDNQTLVAVFDRQEQPVSSTVADRILNQVKSHLN